MPRPLVLQVIAAFDAIATFGTSRHDAKRDGSAWRKIFSYGAFKTYLDRVMACVNWLLQERPQLTELREITHADLRRYVAHCEARGHTGDSIRTVISALRKLECGMRALRWWSRPDPFVPHDLKTRMPRAEPRFGFDLADALAIIASLTGEARQAALLALATGLRIHEVVALRASDVRAEEGEVSVRRGKGGRFRLITWLSDAALLAELEQADPAEYLFPLGDRKVASVIREIQVAIAAARDSLGIDAGTGKNMHAFRAAYAELYLRHAIEVDGVGEDAARARLSQQLGHNRVDVTYRYCPRLTPERRCTCGESLPALTAPIAPARPTREATHAQLTGGEPNDPP